MFLEHIPHCILLDKSLTEQGIIFSFLIMMKGMTDRKKNGARDFSKTDRRTNLGSVGDLNCWTHWILVCLLYFKIGTALLADIVEIYLLYTS